MKKYSFSGLRFPSGVLGINHRLQMHRNSFDDDIHQHRGMLRLCMREDKAFWSGRNDFVAGERPQQGGVKMIHRVFHVVWCCFHRYQGAVLFFVVGKTYCEEACHGAVL